VFLLGRDGREAKAYQGMTMNSKDVAAQIREALGKAGA